MSIRNSFLAILATQPAHGYGLKSLFEESTAGVWPLNAGQVYTTLARMERDGLVETEGGAPDRRSWRITSEGMEALVRWYETPVQDRSVRDELVIKVLVAVSAGEARIGRIVQTQRAATMRQLQEYTQHKMEADPDGDLAWQLLLDALILRAEAEIRWLDRCEARLAEQSTGNRS